MPEHSSWNNPYLPPGEPVEGQTYRADGWAYQHMMLYWIGQHDWDLMEAVAGADQIHVLNKLDDTHPDFGTHMTKVEYLISPLGLLCIREYSERTRQ